MKVFDSVLVTVPMQQVHCQVFTVQEIQLGFLVGELALDALFRVFLVFPAFAVSTRCCSILVGSRLVLDDGYTDVPFEVVLGDLLARGQVSRARRTVPHPFLIVLGFPPGLGAFPNLGVKVAVMRVPTDGLAQNFDSSELLLTVFLPGFPFLFHPFLCGAIGLGVVSSVMLDFILPCFLCLVKEIVPLSILEATQKVKQVITDVVLF